MRAGKLIVLLLAFLFVLPVGTASANSGDDPEDLKRRGIEEYFNCDRGADSGGGCEIANAILKIFEDAGGWSCSRNIYEDPTRPTFNPQGFYQVLRIAGKALCMAQITCVLDQLADKILPAPVTWTDINRTVSVAREEVIYFGRWYYLPEILNALALNYRAQDGRWPYPYSPPQLVLPPTGGGGNDPLASGQTPLQPKAYLITASEDREHLRLYVINLPGVADALKEKVDRYVESVENEARAKGAPLDEDEKRALREDFLSFRKGEGLEPIRFAYVPFGIAQPVEDALGEAKRVIVANLPGVLSTPGGSGSAGYLFFIFAPSERGTEDWKKITGGCVPEVSSGSPLDPGAGKNIYWPSVAGLQFFGKVPEFFNGVVRGFAPFMDLILDFAEALDQQDKDIARGFKRSMPDGESGGATVR